MAFYDENKNKKTTVWNGIASIWQETTIQAKQEDQKLGLLYTWYCKQKKSQWSHTHSTKNKHKTNSYHKTSTTEQNLTVTQQFVLTLCIYFGILKWYNMQISTTSSSEYRPNTYFALFLSGGEIEADRTHT